MKILLGTCGGWHMPKTALALAKRSHLAGLWMTDKNPGLPASLFSRCWLFHLVMKPFYHLAPQIVREKVFYAFSPFWRYWVRSQNLPPCDVVQGLMGFASEIFSRYSKGVLRVVDCPNSHPSSYYGFWQRECDLWCPGEKVPIPRRVFSKMNRELVQADVVLCPSNFVRDSMVANGIPAEKCVVEPFGVDTTVFQPRQLIPKRPRFVSVGTICLRKGHQYLFPAFALVKQKLPEAELVCVGDYKSDFRLQKKRWEGSFSWVRHLPPDELATLLKTCTAFVLPSQEEGFARVILEAMAAGLPIIASYESGATTLVTHGVEGLIVKAQNPREIAEAMVQVACDPLRCEKMGQAAFVRGGTNNSWQDYGDRLIKKFSEILGS